MRINFYSQTDNVSNSLGRQTSGQITSPLILAHDPVGPLEAATKQYVDNQMGNLDAANIQGGIMSAARLPAYTGDLTASTGSGIFSLTNTGITAGTYSKMTVNAKGRVIGTSALAATDIPALAWSKITTGKPTTLAGYGITDAVGSSGGALTGVITLNNAPTNALHAANKAYADTISSGTAGINTGNTLRRSVNVTPTGYLRCNGGIVSKTTYASLYSVIGDTFSITIQPGNGKPWLNQFEFNKETYTALGVWKDPVKYPVAFYEASSVVYNNRIYIFSGSSGLSGSINKVYSNALNAVGGLTEWVDEGTIPNSSRYNSVAIYGNRLYYFGGLSSTVYTAVINNTTGRLSAWTALASTLPVALWAGRAIVLNNRIYYLGGNTNTPGFSTGTSSNVNTVYKATINPDGTLSAWAASIAFNLQGGRSLFNLIKTSNRLYMVGGSLNTGQNYDAGITNQILYISYDGAGDISGTWTTDAATHPSAIASSAVAYAGNYVYLIGGNYGYASGGFPVTGAYSNIWRATITAGVLGAWTDVSALPNVGTGRCAGVLGSKLIIAGGASAPNYSGGSNYYDDAYTFDIDGSGVIGAASTVQINSGFYYDLRRGAVLVTKNKVYVLGGEWSGLGYVNKIYSTNIDPVTGMIGKWVEDASVLPINVSSGTEVIVTKNRVYLLGGLTDGSVPINTIYTAPINSDGTLGTWASAGTMPAAWDQASAIVTGARVYLLGGLPSNGVSSSTVYTAPVNSDGTLGSWSTGPALPYALYATKLAMVKNRLYFFGARTDGGNYNPAMYWVAVNTDGTLATGGWTNAGQIPYVPNSGMTIIVTANRIYSIGGIMYSGTPSDAVYSAPINTNGSIGTWVAETNVLPTTRAYGVSFVTNKRIYMIGGYIISSTWWKGCYSVPFNGGLSDYSPYYDGSNPLTDVSTSFKLPDMTSNETTDEFYFIKT